MSPRVCVLCITLVGSMACARSASPPTAPAPPERKSAELIVDAVRAHDQRCAIRSTPEQPGHMATELGLDRCTTDVDAVELNACLREIEHEPCGTSAKSVVDRIPTCRLGALCTTVEEGTI